MQSNLIGIEIGGTKLQIVVGDGSGEILQRHRFTVDKSGGAPAIRAQLESVLPGLVQQTDPAAIGTGFGGPVDWRTGRIARSHQIEGWSDFDLAGWLQSLTGRRVWIDNDGNVAALGEARRGAGQGGDPVFYVTLGSGVGGGLVVAGNIFHGARPGEAEIGHLRLDRAGTIVESRCSGWAVDARIRELKKSEKPSVLNSLVGNESGGEARHLAAALSQGDPEAGGILRETAANLAFALSHVTHLFHPEIIVLGGGLSFVGEPLRAAVAEALPPWLMEVFRPGPIVKLATLREDAVPVGCLLGAAEIADGRGPSRGEGFMIC
jgi:glucokinase